MSYFNTSFFTDEVLYEKEMKLVINFSKHFTYKMT